jgi:hypothetical protein
MGHVAAELNRLHEEEENAERLSGWAIQVINEKNPNIAQLQADLHARDLRIEDMTERLAS